MKHIKLFESWLNENTDQEKLQYIADALGCSPQEVVSFTVIEGVNTEEHNVYTPDQLRKVFGADADELENLGIGCGDNIWNSDDEESEICLVILEDTYGLNKIPVCVEDGDRWNGYGMVPVLYVCSKIFAKA